MPRTRKKINEIDDAIGTPPTVKRANKAFTKPRPARKKATEPVSEITSEPMPTNVRVKNGVIIPEYPLELRDPEMGDKTPAVVEWYAKHHPKAHDALYAGRIVG